VKKAEAEAKAEEEEEFLILDSRFLINPDS
jgi:hypothetical protein